MAQPLPRLTVHFARGPVLVPYVERDGITCSECAGTGREAWSPCPICRGAGSLQIRCAPVADRYAAMVADRQGLYSAGGWIGEAPSEDEALRGPGWWLWLQRCDPRDPLHDLLLDALEVAR